MKRLCDNINSLKVLPTEYFRFDMFNLVWLVDPSASALPSPFKLL